MVWNFLGILADIHEEVEQLALALNWFHRTGVDQVVVIRGRILHGQSHRRHHQPSPPGQPGRRLGHHDFGLCWESSAATRQKYSGPVLDFMATLRPRLEIGGCLFTHVEPWLDPHDLAQPW